MRYYILIFLFTLTLISCDSSFDKTLKVSANSWIGYSPLFYAKQQGWLDQYNIKLVHVVSLGENISLYSVGNSDAFTGTQYEFNFMHEKDSSLMPIIMFDRSNGGDVVMSNVSINELANGTGKIDAFLEINSVNQIILNDFIRKNNISRERLNYINKDQAEISLLTLEQITEPSIIITYVPYNNQLKDNGFKELASTREGLDLLVLDALYASRAVFIEHKQQFIQLKQLIDQALLDLEKDPELFYTKVKPYLENTSYENFLAGLNDIIWINKELPKDLRARIDEAQFPIRDLL